jgi:alcohol oxidase
MNQVGYPEVDDLQNFENNNAVSHARKTISPEGLRNDTATAYLHPRLTDGKHPNLHVLVHSQVIRVMLDPATKTATGVEYRHEPPMAESAASPLVINARRQVIISCGTLGTPLVLERSGVGDSSILEAAGVPVVAHVPGVGRNLQDHHLTYFPYKANMKPEQTFDGIHSGRTSVEELIQNQEKIMGWNGFDVSAKIRPSESEVDELGPKFRARWDRDFKSEHRRPLVGLIFAGG